MLLGFKARFESPHFDFEGTDRKAFPHLIFHDALVSAKRSAPVVLVCWLSCNLLA